MPQSRTDLRVGGSDGGCPSTSAGAAINNPPINHQLRVGGLDGGHQTTHQMGGWSIRWVDRMEARLLRVTRNTGSFCERVSADGKPFMFGAAGVSPLPRNAPTGPCQSCL